MSWTILLTTPQNEFRVRDELHRRGLSAYVPVEFRWARGKTKTVLRRPVIPGYVFAEVHRWADLGPDASGRAVDGLRSRPVMLIEGRPAVMTQAAVVALEALSQPRAKVARGTRLNIGDRIKIKLGALTDLQADVARITAKGQPVAIVQLFGKQHEVTLGDGQWQAA